MVSPYFKTYEKFSQKNYHDEKKSVDLGLLAFIATAEKELVSI